MAIFASARKVEPERPRPELACEFRENSHRDSIWESSLNSQPVPDRKDRRIRREEQVEAYRMDCFGSVDGILLRSSEDPQPGLREVLMRREEMS